MCKNNKTRNSGYRPCWKLADSSHWPVEGCISKKYIQYIYKLLCRSPVKSGSGWSSEHLASPGLVWTNQHTALSQHPVTIRKSFFSGHTLHSSLTVFFFVKVLSLLIKYIYVENIQYIKILYISTRKYLLPFWRCCTFQLYSLSLSPSLPHSPFSVSLASSLFISASPLAFLTPAWARLGSTSTLLGFFCRSACGDWKDWLCIKRRFCLSGLRPKRNSLLWF